MDFDLQIVGGEVVDGTGGPRRRADVGIKAGRIVTIAEPGGLAGTASKTIDASGLIVAPGFIDVHTHLDAQMFWDPWFTPSCLHGVTTVLAGNCGFTLAPVDDEAPGYIAPLLSRVEGIPLDTLQASVPWSWRSTGEYFEAVERTSPALNFAAFTGHSTIRWAVMREDAVDRRATPAEIEKMQEILAAALADGSLGFSSSGTPQHIDANGNPAPSRLADDAELLALAEVTGRFEGTQLAMIPCAFTEFEQHHVELMTEMSRRAQRTLNWNQLLVDEFTEERLAMSDYAAAHGGRLLAVTYPALLPIHYSFMSSVFDAVPNWAAVMTLPRSEKIAALQRPEVRASLRAGMESPEGSRRPISKLDGQMIESGQSPETKALEGRTLGEVAREQGVHPLDLLLDLQIHDNLALGMRRPPVGEGEDPIYAKMREELWTDDRVLMGASDAGAHLDFLSAFNYTTTFLQCTREQGEVPLEKAVERLTGQPAQAFGLRERGRIAEDWWADICIFDAERVTPGTISWRDDLPGGNGRLYSQPEGVHHVVVNGVEIIRDSEHLEERPGRVLRSGRDTYTVLP